MRPFSRGTRFSPIQHVLCWTIKGYRWTLSPLLQASFQTLFGVKATCRYAQTCSAFAIEAIRKHGTIAGLLQTARRVSACHG